MHRLVKPMASLFVVAAFCAPAPAAFFNKKCCKSAAPCCDTGSHNGSGSDCGWTYQTVEKTVQERVWVTEKQKIKTVECVPVTQAREVSYTRMVPTQEVRNHTVTYCETQQVTKTVNVTVCKPISVQEQRTCTVMVPHTETRSGTRTVCHRVPSVETRTVCKDCGHWECQQVQCGCRKVKTCCGCETVPVYKTKKVWIPNVVQQQVQVNVCKTVTSQEPYTYTVTVCKPETRTETVTVCKMTQVTEPRQVTECVSVPKTKVVSETVTVCKPVVEKKMENFTTYTSKEVWKEVDVRVCRLVEKKVACQVRVPAANNCCSSPAPAPCCH